MALFWPHFHGNGSATHVQGLTFALTCKIAMLGALSLAYSMAFLVLFLPQYHANSYAMHPQGLTIALACITAMLGALSSLACIAQNIFWPA